MKNNILPIKIIAFIIMILTQASITQGQITLTQLNPQPHSDLINDIYQRDSLHIYIVGAVGRIAYSADGGANWINQYLSQNRTLTSIAFADNSTGICIGDSGFIVRTTDAGSTWTPISSGTVYDLNEVYFKNSTTGYIVGNSGIILYTTNAGQTWTPQSSGTSFDLNAIRISSTNAGYIAGNSGTVLKTITGTNWTQLSNVGADDLLELYQINDASIIVAGNNGTIQKTTTSGASWTACTSSNTEPIRDITFIPSTNIGFAVGGYPNSNYTGVVLKTTNGGSTWNTLSAGTTCAIYCIDLLNNYNIFLAGGFGNILKTANQGTTFSYISHGITEKLNSVFFPSSNIGYIAGDNGLLLKTTDAGANWTTIPTGLPPTGGYGNINDLYFFDDTTGIAVANQSTVLRIYHGGDSITQSSFGYTGLSAELCVVHFINRDTGFIGPMCMDLLRTIDGGTTWQLMNTNSSCVHYVEICFPNHHVGYYSGDFAGMDDSFKKTIDCGVSWIAQNSFEYSLVYGIDFINENKGVVGSYGIKLTTDGGSTWNTVFGSTAMGLEYANNNTVYGVGNGGSIEYSHNGGSSWSSVNRITNCNLRRLFFAPSGVGYIVGEHGTIIRINDNILVSDGDAVVSKNENISLYPNPTNGSFTTKFQLTDRSPVEITVYDFSGTLISKKQCGVLDPGVYEYPISSNGMKAGIYIVKVSYNNGQLMSKIIITE